MEYSTNQRYSFNHKECSALYFLFFHSSVSHEEVLRNHGQHLSRGTIISKCLRCTHLDINLCASIMFEACAYVNEKAIFPLFLKRLFITSSQSL